jgi:hypothetical protein
VQVLSSSCCQTSMTPQCHCPGIFSLPVPPLPPCVLFCVQAGMETATAAAAAGGSTTVIDMPLNSFPTTTTAEQVLKKMQIAEVRLSLACVCVQGGGGGGGCGVEGAASTKRVQ